MCAQPISVFMDTAGWFAKAPQTASNLRIALPPPAEKGALNNLHNSLLKNHTYIVQHIRTCGSTPTLRVELVFCFKFNLVKSLDTLVWEQHHS